MPAGTNATVAIVGNTLVTAASFPQKQGPEAGDHRLSARRDRRRDDDGAGTTTGGGDGGAASRCSPRTAAAATRSAQPGPSGQVGPNLDDLKPDAATVEAKVRNGGGGMPAFEGRLSDAEITAVAKYVAENAGKGGGSGGGGGSGP